MALRRIGVRQSDGESEEKGDKIIRVFGFILSGKDILTDKEIVSQLINHWNTEAYPYIKEKGVVK